MLFHPFYSRYVHDELLIWLNNYGLGCHIGDLFSGALAYADDAVLLAPSVSSMPKLLNIFSNFLQNTFNSKRSKHMNFGNDRPIYTLTFILKFQSFAK